jgi:Tol biopolymer transport system component/serine/threonine protein kinase
MNPEQWQRVKETLHTALELPPDERDRFLEQACGEDPALRAEVTSLLSSHESAGDFMDAGPLPMAATPVTTGSGGQAVVPAMAGRRLGPYEIIRELGRGGMGAVYLAIRADGAYRKQVAIKVMRRGVDRDFVARRFRNERQILANLEHPYIARLIDGGTTDDGIPYFVMEYIEGKPIDEYCDTARLSTTERLKLFRKVCSAVHLAHEHKVIHRDIKPGNILVTEGGLPKLLDFGIAKILDRAMASETVDPTMTMLRLLTPEYASPEQIRGEPITPAADIYSLGVLLYELLTGHRPYRLKNRTPHEIAQAICEEQPMRPSTAVKRVEQITRKPGEPPITITPETVSEARAAAPTELRKRLCGDLDNIVLMAMRKEPQRRYATADELSEDLARHLEGAPVRARKDAFLYRASRLVRKRSGSLVAMTATAAAVAVLSTTLWNRAQTPAADFSRSQASPFTAFAGDETQAAFSPDGKALAFVWRGADNANADIYVKSVGANSAHRLTWSQADDVSPVWSPDGSRIAFLRVGRNESGFYIVNADGGGNETRIADASPIGFELLGRQLDWGRDAGELLIVDRMAPNAPFAVYSLNPANGRKTALTTPTPNSQGDVNPTLSPDKRALAFIRITGSGVTEAFVQPIDGGSPRQLTRDNRWIASLSWSPDGSEIIFSSNRVGNSSLWRIPAQGGSPERVAGVGQNTSDAVFSRDGLRMAYSQSTIDSNIWRFDLNQRSYEQLIGSTQYDSSPQYSPDGQRIVFRSNRSGTNEIWVADRNGENPVQLTRYRGPLTGTPRWSHDGKWIAFDSRPEGHAQIYVISASGGTPRRLTDLGMEVVVPSWSMDSKWVYYGGNRDGVWQVWKKPLDGGAAVQVTRNGGFAAFESPDGRYVYYAKARNVPGLWRVPVEGGQEIEILPDLQAGYWGYFALTPHGVFYVDQPTPASPAVLRLFDTQTGRKTTLFELPKPLQIGTSAFAVSPDGKHVLIAQQDHSSSDIMLAERAVDR